MLPDRLITAGEPHASGAVGRAVLDVLGGEQIARVAERSRIEPTNLADAVEVFKQAGFEALSRHAASVDWWQIYIEFTDWHSAEQTAALRLPPLLRTAQREDSVTDWWFIRKYPCWRIRLLVPQDAGVKTSIGTALDRLTAAGHLRRWWPGIYEPETAAFGGAASMTAAHRLFTADSRQILHLATRHDVPLRRRELSILLCTTMMRAAGLEWYEQGDVWNRVIGEEHRSVIDGIPPERLQTMAEQLRTLLAADTDAAGPMLTAGGPMEPISEWAAAFRQTGLTLAAAVRMGELDRGLRRVLAYHVIFHWNRLGLSMPAQSVLAWAARTAIIDPPAGS